jgi:DNA-binding MarR family transcriptional regulator
MTGIIDRLERGGWVARDRGTADRRAVLILALRDRNSELLHLYSGMNIALDQICAGYNDAELRLLAGFLSRTAQAGQTATDELAGD